MARGIGIRMLAGGNRVTVLGRDGAAADELARELRSVVPGGVTAALTLPVLPDADVFVLAVPFEAARELVELHRDDLGGRILIDITNPVDFQTFDGLVVDPGDSAAETLARLAGPEVRVVKAFNTTFASTLIDGRVDGHPLDVFVASDDTAAGLTVAELVKNSGLTPVDAGPLRRARELEAFQFLHMTLQDRLGLSWSSALKILR
ncbi:NADPH-dependent F420 reductase [Actinocorallia longicatena]|uniref:NADPH-dependent F420 reductase n=2 Tax=Actinocorallia longicatena TaxID=111803 RepID=A0ABP6Q7Y1_9ACTN